MHCGGPFTQPRLKPLPQHLAQIAPVEEGGEEEEEEGGGAKTRPRLLLNLNSPESSCHRRVVSLTSDILTRKVGAVSPSCRPDGFWGRNPERAVLEETALCATGRTSWDPRSRAEGTVRVHCSSRGGHGRIWVTDPKLCNYRAGEGGRVSFGRGRRRGIPLGTFPLVNRIQTSD